MPLTAERSPAELTSELWRRCYVADTEDEAYAQAARQFDDFAGEVILVDRVTGLHPDTGDYDEFELTEPVAVVVAGTWDNEGWDGESLYPDWRIRPANPDVYVTDTAHRTFRLANLGSLAFTAPGVGTRDGFAHRDDADVIEPAS